MQSRWVFTNPQESYLTKAQEVGGGDARAFVSRWEACKESETGGIRLVCCDHQAPVCSPSHRPLHLVLSCPAIFCPQVSLNYHMKCEQYTHSATRSFFNFNGTAGGPGPCKRGRLPASRSWVKRLFALFKGRASCAQMGTWRSVGRILLSRGPPARACPAGPVPAGVWRLACIEHAGGWNARTTVEDMDLSLRAYIRGWRAIFLDDVTCLNEASCSFLGGGPGWRRSAGAGSAAGDPRQPNLRGPGSLVSLSHALAPSPCRPGSLPPPQLPASFFAYRKQQHRWTCGPIQLWAKASADVWASQLPLPRKLELVLLYFGVRKCATHLVSLGFFCTLVPLTVFTPEVGAWVGGEGAPGGSSPKTALR